MSKRSVACQEASVLADPVLTIPQIAAHSNVSEDTIRRAIKRGELSVIQLGPRRIGIRLSEYERWLSSRTRAATGSLSVLAKAA